MTVVAIRDEHDIAAQSAALAIRPGQEFWTDKQRAALTVLGIKDATNAELAVFMHYCQKTGLDPFSRQVYMIARREKQGNDWVTKQTIQTGIDGFRVIRDRVARQLGVTVEYEDTIWYDGDGHEHKVWLWEYPPVACKVVVLKDGHRFPAVLRTASYAAVNKDGDMMAQWRTQADHMIEKCAEAMALRRAFPHDLGGLYVEEEMPQQRVPVQVRAERVTPADIIGTPDPAAQDPHSATPDAEPAPPATTQAGKRLLFDLDEAFRRLDIDEETQPGVIAWLAGDWTASARQVRDLTSQLLSFITADAAQGDLEEARSLFWQAYNKAAEVSNA